ncbi:hypothetical protein PsB1_2210 [Candidatus Phycosocius spiralis]|uniref:Flagellar M-ring N-terminal domain-containing protein n=1 Tax=Candidatus Phycosocius spiralis TaxID=2815099 RepID=A0ABQ4PYM4_9PROT|nr:hypothetical protein PsB1_2210 [Candidatus Phycosocius spiralis]
MLFATLVIGLVAIYFFFLKVNYAPLQTGLRTAESALIVSELDRQGFDYRLAAGGSEIQVRSDQVDKIRVAIAGAGIQAGGLDGFELFNQSEMGLTDFAQKIKYLRALQGELSRTIMMIEGVEDARVHIAMPERTLFRNDRSLTKAAVSLILSKDHPPTPEMVIGIQRLVAASIPDLQTSNVIILDHSGITLSQTKPEEVPSLQELDPSPLAIATRAIVAQSIPGMRFSVFVTSKSPPARADRNAEPFKDTIATLEISTQDPLNAQQRDSIIETLVSEKLLVPEDRNLVSFTVLDPILTYDAVESGGVPPASRAPSPPVKQDDQVGLLKELNLFGPSVYWWAGGLLILLIAALVGLITWRKLGGDQGLSREERQLRADELRKILTAYRKSVLTHGQ